MQLPTQLLRRKPNSHKGDFGHIFILAGSAGFCGAAILSARAALRGGAGLVTLGIPQSLHNVFAGRIVEGMIKLLPETKDKTLSIEAYHEIMKFIKNKANVLVIGPGLSQNKSTRELIRKIIKNCPKPLVIDADGLNALAKRLDILHNKNQKRTIVLTPHPKEMSRLTGISVAKIKKNRKTIAKRVAVEYNSTIALKGHKTIVADNKNIYINKTGNPGMATAGSGDVLSGLVGAFLAQGLSAFNATKCAVYIHGKAGDIAAKAKTQLSLIASDIVDSIPAAIKKNR